MDLAKLVPLGTLAILGCAEAAPAAIPSQLFISDYRANAIFRYDGVTGAFDGVFAEGSAQHVNRPAGVRLGPAHQLYAAGFGRGEVVRYDVHSGAMMDVFYWDTALLEEPVELAFHGEDLVVLGNDTNNIVVIGPDGRAARTFGYPVMRGAHDFVIVDDRVYVATERAIQVWDLAAGTQLATFGTPDELALAVSIASDRDGTLLVADWERDRIVRYTADGAFLGVVVGDLESPISLEVGLDGALYVLGAAGLHRLDGGARSLLVAPDDRLLWPRAFTFVSDAELALY